ncbi:hypothetical protein QCD83_20485 [Pseudomonas savastanoi pv. phaseolicola]|uniref:Uncharacterized protein n=5 Tax=Pseudomonas syringae group genomosp. 2 TaxID=251698 RepID=A0A0P9S367_PSESG|nr:MULTISPECIES: hypothetical protein [Pseudomonas]KPB85706.1 Uncharacterized protein AC504_5278 [Pseudomonas syringae pv. maculicola]AAZ37350.1 conserved hypothetical protein [Pseudomonas savastanoi pv. phaseolicola 1448A]EFW82642.1 hypothetical protein PsgB076_00784 [Pseudomonas savastanoi pv. glycinea str. B076]EFW87059.1 hypothetical protein PsgRace4_05196 [Pseudomonas savastanoi pv. glycinea str. race 4]KPB31748.1 Uncharacterized protein AC514_0194 [Pseudomonas savastanoi pv. phaseolicola
MDSTQQPEDDGIIRIQRLVPGQVDVVLGAHPSRKLSARPGKSRPYWLWLAGLIVAGCLAGLVVSHGRSPKVVLAPPVERPAPEPETTVIDSEPTMVASPAPAPSIHAPDLIPVAATREQPAAVQPLDNCMKSGNVIDESVLNCRFGQVPRPAQAEPAKGMVSADYMADFKANAARNPARSARPYSVATASIREWDGRNRYRAQWRVYGNTIDGDSVCENFAIRSFERRECRKAAQVNFKEECREWTKRAARNRDEDSKNAEQRYCEVAATFSP